MKAILINAKKQTVTEITLGDDITEMQKVIECRSFTSAGYTESGDAVYCDDEGLYNPNPYFVQMAHYPQPIAGNVLILGVNGAGESQDAVSDLESIKNDVIFMSQADVLAHSRYAN